MDTIEFIFTEGGLETFLSKFGTDMYTLRGGRGVKILFLFLTEEAYSHGSLQTRELGQTPLC